MIDVIATAPLVARPVSIQLPQRTDRQIERPDPAPPIELRLDAANQLRRDGEPMPMPMRDLWARLRSQADAHAGSVPRLRAVSNAGAAHEGLAKILAAAESTGMQCIHRRCRRHRNRTHRHPVRPRATGDRCAWSAHERRARPAGSHAWITGAAAR